MKLVITIDTEEDNWGKYDLSSYSLLNIDKINVLQDLFDRYGVTPTYLVTYPVATDEGAIKLLRQIMEDGRCEIGTHCHPWNTPPFEEAKNKWNSMLCNLTADLQLKKIETLHKAIVNNFGVTPTSFRAGRWGFSAETSRVLGQLSYKVDSSILAFHNWKNVGGPDNSEISPHSYILSSNEGDTSGSSVQLYEIPATAGYTHGNFEMCNKVWQLLEENIPRKLHIKGLFDQLGVLNKIWLSPETSSAKEMIKLTTVMMQSDYDFVNMFFHSNALKAGYNPYVTSREDEISLLHRIEEYLDFARQNGMESIKLSNMS